jgi:hypothetical protein
MAGSVFFWEGILKFVCVNQGVVRFTKLGFPFPDVTASFVGGLEIVGGLLILLGLGTRFVAAHSECHDEANAFMHGPWPRREMLRLTKFVSQ